MPALARARTICPRCPNLKPCSVHQGERRREFDRHRGSARSRGYDTRWERRRDDHLALERNCRHHALGLAAHPYDPTRRDTRQAEAGVVVDHVVPHRGRSQYFNDRDNLQTLCRPCDDRKRARENGLIPCEAHGEQTTVILAARVCIACGGVA